MITFYPRTFGEAMHRLLRPIFRSPLGTAGPPPPAETVLWVMRNGQLEPVQGVVKGT